MVPSPPSHLLVILFKTNKTFGGVLVGFKFSIYLGGEGSYCGVGTCKGFV